jgi:uncharacterized UBP type Zn finger protein
MSAKCKHLDQIKITTTDTHVCEECVKLGDTWVHLRLCMSCGNVGCCDSSKNKHATKHYRHVHHPVMRSIEPGEKWIWCYIDEMIVGEARLAGVSVMQRNSPARDATHSRWIVLKGVVLRKRREKIERAVTLVML